MMPKSKLMRLYTLQNRLDSIIKDFREIPNVSRDLLLDLNRAYVIIDKCIIYVSPEDRS